MKQFQILQVLTDLDIESSDLWIAEAKFGFSYLKEKLLTFEEGSDILEVGCGSGILLSMAAEEFPQHRFTGIEPFGDGFSKLKELNNVVKNLGVNLIIKTYEAYKPENKYDLIYCVNVFEHVDDWRVFLNWASENLKKGGVFLILCPNYGFPYESHFKIPIIFNKNITYKLFKSYIKKFEQNNDVNGLWNSLNFVKKRELLKFYNQNRSSLKFNICDEISIIDDMLQRMNDDKEFRKRQSFIGFIAILIKKYGIFDLIKKFPNYIPYMKISFVKFKL